MERYKPDQIITYIPTNQRVRVIHNTLSAGGTNAAEAVVTVYLPNRMLVSVPVAVQDKFLTTRRPSLTLKNGFGFFMDAVPESGPIVKENPTL